MRSGTIALLLGVWLLQQLPALPPPALYLPLLPGLLLLFALHGRKRQLLGLLLCIGLGAGYAQLHAAHILATHLPPAMEGEDLVVEGTIDSLPQRSGRRTRFEFKLERLQGCDACRLPMRVRLSWYGRHPRLAVGERWRLQVRLKRPHGMLNPGAFDYEGWLFRQRLRATGYVRQVGPNARLAPAGYRYPVQQVRQWLDGAIDRALGDSPRRGLLTALAIGERRGISDAQWAVLTATGTNHLMAISGLHIGIIAGLVFLLVRRLWALSLRLGHALAADRAAAIAALLAAGLYATLAGFAIPTQRALVMVAVTMGAVLLQRHVQPSRVLALALLLVLLLDPLAVLAPGFWLSFAAVAVILYGMGGRLAGRGLWWRWGRVQWLVAVGLTPLLWLLFQQASLSAPLANLVAVPWMSLAVVPLTLLGTLTLSLSPGLGSTLLQLADSLLAPLWQGLAWLAEGVPPAWGALAPPAWTLVPALVGVGLLLAPRGVPARWLGAFWLAPLLLVRPAAPGPGELWLSVLDVGQGLAVVARTREHTLVYDTGPRLGSRLDGAKVALIPFLRQQGIRYIDTLIVSHGDSDHSGGARSLAAALPIGRSLTVEPERLSGLEVGPCIQGQGWQWDGIGFELLHPPPAHYQGERRGHNDASCVLRINTPAGAVLLAGDIEAAGERALLRAGTQRLAARLLLAPHHGSKTSSTEPFISAVDPEYVVFSVGYRNRYRFPHPQVVARYAKLGTERLQTARLGAITFYFGPGGLTWDNYRRRAPRYWHWRPAEAS